MADIFSILGQSKPLATTLTGIYTVPASTSTVISSVVVCNQSATPTNFRISLAVNGTANDTKQYLYYDVPIDGNDSFVSTIGISLKAGDVIRVYATLATLSFTLLGCEIT